MAGINVRQILEHFKAEEAILPSAKQLEIQIERVQTLTRQFEELELKIADDSLDEPKRALAADQQREVRSTINAIDRQIQEYRARRVRTGQDPETRLRKGLMVSIKQHAAKIAEEKDYGFVFDSSVTTIQKSPAIFTLSQSPGGFTDITGEIIKRMAGDHQTDGSKKAVPEDAADTP